MQISFNIYTLCCIYFTITLRDICIYCYLLFNVIFGNISCISWRENFNSAYWKETGIMQYSL